MPETLGEYALAYAEMGIAVFPLVPGMKIPTKDSNGVNDATTDPEQIRKWWQENPNYNIGMATGEKSKGLYLADIDTNPAKHKEGAESYRRWVDANGEFPSTWTVTTATGGIHYYYRAPEKYKSTDNVGGYKHIDQKGEGGYGVAPPSFNKETGKRYTWVDGHSPFDGPVTMLSGSALKFAQQEPYQGQQTYKKDFSYTPIEDKISEGGRHGALMSLIGRLRSAHLSAEAIKAAVDIENQQRCVPPLPETELSNTIYPAITREGWSLGKPYFSKESIWLSQMPEPFSLRSVSENPPELAPVLIDGVLRRGHKMLLSAPSKAGKSFALMHLAIAIAEGFKWFGNRCTQGKVLYINMEIAGASCINRFLEIYRKLGLNVDNHMENIMVWDLRGYAQPLKSLTDKIIAVCKDDISAIIIDPLYKVMDGDENSNSDISRMVGNFDHIARETGAAVIYAHHFAKGASGDKAVIDRASGAGTFARDPDAIITMTQLDMPDEVNEIHTAWRIEYILREFPNHKPYNVWFEYPWHVYDPQLDDAEIETTASRAGRRKENDKQKIKEQRIKNVHQIVAEISNARGEFLASDFEDKYAVFEDVSEKTMKRRLHEAGYEASQQSKVGEQAYWKRKK